MLHGFLADPGTYDPLPTHPTWNRALEWLRVLPADIALGHYELAGPEMFASVQEYDTVDRAVARFESHREHVDLQYTIRGTEGIDWCPRSELEPTGPFANDVQFWLPPPAPWVTLVQSPGRFAVFYPSDAHRPKVSLGFGPVRKLVIKIPLKLLA